MAKGAKKGGRIRDKWRDKQWVVVNSPSAFASGPLNYIPITSVESCKGRVIENTMFDILRQDPTQHQTKVFVQIESIHDGIANTIFKGHEYAKEFLRSLVRRGSSMISYTHDYTTSDGYTFRVVMVAFSQKRINSSKRHEVRILAHKVLARKIPQLTIDQFVQEATMGKMGADLLGETKKVAPLRHIGIRKTKLISTPQSKAIQGAKAIEPMEISSEQEDSGNDSETQENRSAQSTDE
jgi:small subunit ribosomal protein S3Ae